jgi:uncharacterized membrane protein
VLGATRRSLAGAGLAALGGYFLYSGIRHQRPASELLGVHRHPVSLERAVTIDRPIPEVYQHWRNFENLSRLMPQIETVEVDGRCSHWVAKTAPGTRVEWEAEITSEVENEMVAWRSLPGSLVQNAGVVRFEPASGGRGTVVRAQIEYCLPVGRVGAAQAAAFGSQPEQLVRETLRRFKQLMETGEIATTEGQPSGPRTQGARVVQFLLHEKGTAAPKKVSGF